MHLKINQITIYNILGELILEQKPNREQISIDVSKWTNNIYTIHIFGKDFKLIEKLFIQH